MSYNTLPSLFKGICDAVRYKTNETGLINHQDIPQKIMSIEGGGGECEEAFVYIDEDVEILDFDILNMMDIETSISSKAKTIKLIDKLSAKGISQSSTVEEIKAALDPAIEKFCELSGMILSRYDTANNSLQYYFKIDGVENEVFTIMMSAYSQSYRYTHLIYGMVLSTDVPAIDPYKTYVSYSGENTVKDTIILRVIDIYNHDLCMNYYAADNGDFLFDLYSNESVIRSNHYNFALTKYYSDDKEINTLVSFGNTYGKSNDYTIMKSLNIEEGIISNYYKYDTKPCNRITLDGYFTLLFTFDNDIVSQKPLHTCTYQDMIDFTNEYVLNERFKVFSNNMGYQAGSVLSVDDRKFLVITKGTTNSFVYEITEEEL